MTVLDRLPSAVLALELYEAPATAALLAAALVADPAAALRLAPGRCCTRRRPIAQPLVTPPVRSTVSAGPWCPRPQPPPQLALERRRACGRLAGRLSRNSLPATRRPNGVAGARGVCASSEPRVCSAEARPT